MNFVFESEAAFLLILANVVMFFYVHYTQAGSLLVEKIVLNPENLFSGRYYCLVTTGFLHGNSSHLFFNMLGLFIFGRIVERHLGFGKTIFIFFGALIISMFFSTLFYFYIWEREVTIIGASGAVMGLMACAMLLDPFSITYEMILPIPLMFKGWLFFYADLVGVLGGETDGISHLAHLFGFLSVGILAYFLSREDKKMIRVGVLINVASFFGFLLIRAWFLTPK